MLLKTETDKGYKVKCVVSKNKQFSLLELHIENKDKILIERINIATCNGEGSHKVLTDIGTDFIDKLSRILPNGYTLIGKAVYAA